MHSNTARFSRGLLAVAALSLLLVGSHANAQSVNEIVNRQLTQRHIPGMSIAVVKDGKVVTAKGYGVANVELDVPATENTVYQLASITKQFTATAIMMLVQEGKLGLDDKISSKLPDLPAAWSEVTIRQLLTHTSGIKDYAGTDGAERHPSEDMTQAAILNLVATAPLNFPSGSKYNYSNTGYFLLGMLIEKLSGKSYGEFLNERIFQPLGMSATRFNDAKVVIKHRATGYTFQKNVLQNASFVSPSKPFSAGGLVSNIADMIKWDAALNGEKLLPRATLESMWVPTKLTGGTDSDYGFGWGIQKKNGHRILAHNGGIDGFGTTIVRLPEDKLTVIVLANSDGARTDRIAMEIATAYLPDLKEPVINDSLPAVTTLVRAFLDRVATGKAEPTDFTPDGQAYFFPDRINQLKGFLGSIGGVQSMELIAEEDRGTARMRRYRVSGANASALISFVLTKDGNKIDGILIRPA